ncbi:MAG TPA: YfiR family protein [Rhodocyclaceae bacterium]|nr:YfiR family protein [Rhodocyclaceae bacterium]
MRSFSISALLCGLTATSALGQTPPPAEYSAKAAFIYNFTRFVEWPPQAFSAPSAPLNVCLLGDDPFGAHFDAIAGKRAQGRELTIKRLISVGQIAPCHLLFISASEEKRLRQVLAPLKTQAVLTVGDMDRFAENGGVVNMAVEGHRIAIEINLDAAARHGLGINANLLRLARIVREKP